VTLAIIVMTGIGNTVLLHQAQAQGLAISGSFYRHHFQMLPGESFATPDVYIVVFNHDTIDKRVRLTPTAPPGVEVQLDEFEFTIPTKSNRSLAVGVYVSEDTTPGEYYISIRVDVLPDEVSGISIVGAAEQRAMLTVFGEAGTVNITTVTPDGELFLSKMHLYQKLDGGLSPAGYSETGRFNSRLVPGEYMVQVFFGDDEVAKEEFALAAGEEKNITLVAQTVFILGFSASPSYDSATGKISIARTVYTIKNIYRPLKDMRAILQVSLNGSNLESIEIISVPALDLGNTGGRYDYAPSEGWAKGTYSFRLELFSQDKLYATSVAQTIAVSPEQTTGAQNGLAGAVKWILIIALPVLLLAALLILWLRRRR